MDAIHKKVKPYECSGCGFCSSTQRGIKQHMTRTHYRCSHCDFVSTREILVKSHMLSVHAEEKGSSNGQSSSSSVVETLQQVKCELDSENSKNLNQTDEND